DPIWGCAILVSRAKVIENQVMAIFVISVSSDSSEESVRTSAGRVILFRTIPTTISDITPTVTPPTTHVDTTLTPTEIPSVSPIIPPSPDYTPALPDYSPASDMEFDPSEDPSSYHIPSLLATSPLLSSTNDSSDNDTHDTPPSLTHAMILAPGQPIPYGRPYCYHPNGSVHMMTARKRVGLLPTYRLAVRHSVDYSSSYLLTFDDSSETSSDSSSNAIYDSSSGHSYSDHSSPALPSGMRSSHQLCSSVPSIPYSSIATTERPSHSSFVGPFRKRSRSPATSVLISSPIPRALSFARADLLPPPKRIRSSNSATNLEDCLDESSESSVPRKTSLRDDVVIRGSDEPYSEPDIDLEIQAEIDECIAYSNALRDEGIDARVVVETVAREEDEGPGSEEGAIEGTYQTLGDLVQRFHDQTVEIPAHRVQVIESIQKDQGTMTNTRSGETMTREVVNELIDRRVAEALETHNAARNLKPFLERGGEQDDKNGGVNGNGGNGNGGVNGNGGDDNGNGNGNREANGYNFGGFMPVARECTYQDFLKCQPLNFNGTE
ncbi:hypothetical protein Tco_0052218, partial [Tanacetum coccineum]